MPIQTGMTAILPRRSADSAAGTELLDVAQAANYLTVSERFVRRLVAERRVPFVKLGKFVRFYRADLDAFVAQGRVEGER